MLCIPDSRFLLLGLGSVVKVEGEKQWLKGKTAGRRASDEGKGIFGQNSAAGAEHGHRDRAHTAPGSI